MQHACGMLCLGDDFNTINRLASVSRIPPKLTSKPEKTEVFLGYGAEKTGVFYGDIQKRQGCLGRLSPRGHGVLIRDRDNFISS